MDETRPIYPAAPDNYLRMQRYSPMMKLRLWTWMLTECHDRNKARVSFSYGVGKGLLGFHFACALGSLLLAVPIGPCDVLIVLLVGSEHAPAKPKFWERWNFIWVVLFALITTAEMLIILGRWLSIRACQRGGPLYPSLGVLVFGAMVWRLLMAVYTRALSMYNRPRMKIASPEELA
jgi:hypothetical protein